jgi:hypothetical protein
MRSKHCKWRIAYVELGYHRQTRANEASDILVLSKGTLLVNRHHAAPRISAYWRLWSLSNLFQASWTLL